MAAEIDIFEEDTTKRRRKIKRKVQPKQGQARIIELKKKRRGMKRPKISPLRIPSLVLGAAFLSYGILAYEHRAGNLASADTGLLHTFQVFFDSITGIAAIFLTGLVATGIGIFIGYAMLTKGFKIKRWGQAWRHIIALYATLIILSAIISPFVNEPGNIRQQSEDDYNDVSGNYDLSALSSPFYQELLDGLLNLLGDIPEPNAIVANITANDGFSFDQSRDQYLWRWQIAETYDKDKMDFIQGFENELFNYEAATYDSSLSVDQMRSFRVSEQYLTITTSYTGTTVNPWNSEEGAMIGSTDNIDFNINPSSANVIDNGFKMNLDVNGQPTYDMYLDSSSTSGAVIYDTMWKAEDKEGIASGSIKYSELNSYLNNLPESQFFTHNTADEVSKVWGEKALYTGDGVSYRNNDFLGAFAEKYDTYYQVLADDPSIYSFVLMINNDITNSIIQALANGQLNIDPTQTQSSAGDGVDKAYYYFDAVKNGNSFGIQDLIAGYVNLLRAFNIPARPVMGFSVGDITPSQIQLQLKHLHVWVEALIPWTDSEGTHYSWGIFNPVPDPYLLSQGYVYGRNNLGGNANINMQVTTGTKQTIDDPTLDYNTLYIQDLNSFFNTSVQVSYNNLSIGGQTVSMRLISETDLQNTGANPLNIGTDLGTVKTSTEDGWGTISLNVTRKGVITRIYDNGTVWNITRDTGTTINTVSLTGSGGSYNAYAIVAIYGLSYGQEFVAWMNNANISLEINIETKQITYGTDSFNASAAIPLENLQLTATIVDSQKNPIAGEDTIDLLMMNRDQFTALQAQFTAGTVDPTTIAQYTEATFPASDANGKTKLNYTFSLSSATDDVYTLIAYLRNTEVFSNVFIYLSGSVDLNSSANYYGNNRVDSYNGVVWDVRTSALELNGTYERASGFTPRDANNVPLSYYVMEKTLFESTYYGQSYNTLKAYIDAGNCVTTATTSQCFYFDTNSPATEFYLGNGTTTKQGYAVANVHINVTAFPVGYYVFIIVSHDFKTFANTSYFLVAAPPLIGSISYDFSVPLNTNIELPNIFKNPELREYRSIIVEYIQKLNSEMIIRRF